MDPSQFQLTYCPEFREQRSMQESNTLASSAESNCTSRPSSIWSGNTTSSRTNTSEPLPEYPARDQASVFQPPLGLMGQHPHDDVANFAPLPPRISQGSSNCTSIPSSIWSREASSRTDISEPLSESPTGDWQLPACQPLFGLTGQQIHDGAANFTPVESQFVHEYGLGPQFFDPSTLQQPLGLPNPYQQHDVAKLAEEMQYKLPELDRDELSYLRDILRGTLRQVDSLLQQTPSADLVLTPPSSTICTQPQWICKLCSVETGRKFNTLGVFKRHVVYTHAQRYSYHCPTSSCDWSSYRKDKLIGHVRINHAEVGHLSAKVLRSVEREKPPPASCPICSHPVDSWDSFFSCLANHCYTPDDEVQMESIDTLPRPPSFELEGFGVQLPSPIVDGQDHSQKRKRPFQAGSSNAGGDRDAGDTNRMTSVSLGNNEDENDSRQAKRFRQSQPNVDVDASPQLSLDEVHPPMRLDGSQSTGEICSSSGHESSSRRSSMQTNITTPQDEVAGAIDACIVQPNDLSAALNPANHYEKLEDLELETARICGVNQTLSFQDRTPSIAECVKSLSSFMDAFDNLRIEGFCGDHMSILVDDPYRQDVAKVVQISWDEIDSILCFLREEHGPIVADIHVNPLVHKLSGGDDFHESEDDLMSRLNFICTTLCIGLLSFSGSHVCRFDISTMGQQMESVVVGLGRNFNLRKLACLDTFIGGPAWVLGRGKSQPCERELKVSLTVQDLQELWGPVWMVGDTPEKGLVIRTERGYIVPLPQQEQHAASLHEIECHWTVERPELSLAHENRPVLRSTSRVLIGTDRARTGLSVNRECKLNTSLVQQRIACQLQLPGATRAHIIEDGYEVNLTGGQYVTTGFTKKWKRIPARTQRTALIELCTKSQTPLIPLLELRVGLEVSACTGNAQRATLWEVLRLSHETAKDSTDNICAKSSCEHGVGDINCINSCWNRYRSPDAIDALDYFRELNVASARRFIIDCILALQYTGIDGEANLQAWWPFSNSPSTCRIPPATSSESNNWFRVIKDTRDTSAFAVLSQRCLDPEERYIRECSCSRKNGHMKVHRTGLYTRLLSAERELACLAEGAKFLVGGAHLTVERPLNIDQMDSMVAVVSTNPLRYRFGSFLTEGRDPKVKELVDDNNTTGLSVPVLVY